MRFFQYFRFFQELYEFYGISFNCCGIKSTFLRFCIDYFVNMVLHRNRFAEDYQKLLGDYDTIAVHRLHYVTRLGEMVARLLNAKSDIDSNRKKRILDLVFVGSYPLKERRKSVQNELGLRVLAPNITNPELYGMVCRKYPNFVTKDNLLFYMYVFKHFKGAIDLSSSSLNRYLNRINDKIYASEKTVDFITFSEEETALGHDKSAKLGIKTDYVCVFSRDSAFVASEMKADSHAWQHNDYRDADINTFAQTTEYLGLKNIVAVRMGKIVKDKCVLNNCIDYPNIAYDGFMDLHLIKNCKFFLGNLAGICILPMLFNKPIAFVNAIPLFSETSGSHPQSLNTLYIFKKYYSNHKKRFLSLQEMMDFDAVFDGRSPQLKENEIDIINNSAEEILALATEMNERLDKTWIETAEDQERQQKYQKAVADLFVYNQLNLNTVLYGNVGSDFLRSNWDILFPNLINN